MKDPYNVVTTPRPERSITYQSFPAQDDPLVAADRELNREIDASIKAWPAWLKALDPGPDRPVWCYAWFLRIQPLYLKAQAGDTVAEYALRFEAERAAKPNPLLR